MVNFQGTYVKPPDSNDLAHNIQKEGESVCKFGNCFITNNNQIVDNTNEKALVAFENNVSDEWLARELGHTKLRTMADLT